MAWKRTIETPLIKRYVVGGFVSLCVLIFLSVIGVSGKLDSFLRDYEFRILAAVNPRTLQNDIEIIGIDDVALEEYKKPFALWHKEIGALLKNLSTMGPRLVAIDVVLPAYSVENYLPGYDRAIMEGLVALRNAQIPVVMAASFQLGGEVSPIYAPFISLAGGADSVGTDLLPLDDDYVIRRHTENLNPGSKDSTIPTLVGQIARKLGLKYHPGLIDYTISTAPGYTPIKSILNAGTVPRLEGGRSIFEGKVVLIGSVLPEVDQHLTPRPLLQTGGGTYSPGVYVHGQAVRSLLGGGLIQPIDVLSQWWLVVVLVIVTGAISLISAKTCWAFCAVAIPTLVIVDIALLKSGYALGAGLPVMAVLIASSMGSVARWRHNKHLALIESIKSRSKSVFIRNISHDIRTPLTALLGSVEMLSRMKGRAMTDKYLGVLKRSAHNILEQIDNLLDVDRFDVAASTDIGPSEHFSIIAITASLCDQLSHYAGIKGVVIESYISLDVPSTLIGHPKAMRRVLMNLVGNAIKYSDKGRIRIRVEKEDDAQILISIKDDGQGIADTDIPRAFNEYLRLSSSKGRESGFGLGTSISRDLVESMGGTIRVASKLNRGSTFYVYLPLVADQDKSTPLDIEASVPEDLMTPELADAMTAMGVALRTHGDDKDTIKLQKRCDVVCGITSDALERHIKLAGPSDGKDRWVLNQWMNGKGAVITPDALVAHLATLLRAFQDDISILIPTASSATAMPGEGMILVVDDSLPNLELMGSVIQDEGYTVIRCTQANEALAAVRSGGINLALIDYRLPDMTGLDLAAAIRASGNSLRDIPLVLVSADVLPEFEEAKKDGIITASYTKPLMPEMITRIVSEFAMHKRSVWKPAKLVREELQSPSDNTVDQFIDVELLTVQAKALGGIHTETIEKFFTDLFRQADAVVVSAGNSELDDEETRRLADGLHKLGGTAGTMGALALMKSCKNLRNELMSRGRSGLDQYMLDLSDVLQKTKQAWIKITTLREKASVNHHAQPKEP